MTNYDRDSAVRAALRLEEIRFTQWLNESTTKRNSEIAASRRNLAGRGSPVIFAAEANIMLTSIEASIDKAISLRRESGGKVPSLLNPANLQQLAAKLESFVDTGIQGIKQWAATQRGGGHAPAPVMQELQLKVLGLKARITQELAALSLEAKLGMPEVQKPAMTTSNISNRTIANVNLRNVIGDIKGSIQQLNASGHSDLAEAFKRITQAIGASSELSDDAKTELLEHVSLVSGEASKPPEARKMGLLRTSIAAITSGLSVATQALAMWQQVQELLIAAGIIHG